MKKFLWFLIVLLCINMVFAVDVSISDYDPKPAEAGKPVNVWFKVENPTVDPESDISIEIIPKDGLRLTSGEDSSSWLPTNSAIAPATAAIGPTPAFRAAAAISVAMRGASSPTASGSSEVKNAGWRSM